MCFVSNPGLAKAVYFRVVVLVCLVEAGAAPTQVPCCNKQTFKQGFGAGQIWDGSGSS